MTPFFRMTTHSIGIGSALGAYKVIAAIGAGGMGEVYRATDSKLGRDVALKVLPDEFAQDPERMARFEREARVLASLNHPNIAHLYGLESSPVIPSEAEGRVEGPVRLASLAQGKPEGRSGVVDASPHPGPSTPSSLRDTSAQDDTSALTFLVMELVEGEDLSERIARGPIPVDEAIPIALQIAEALEAAHEQGIVHRDLKPANIKLTDDGTVKVLDFGLARAWETDAGDSSLSLSPTLTRHATVEGLILGTAAYMSPEQARGKKVDRRADIWAFGVVLWEMLTGRKLFEGETVTDILAAVLTREPDLAALPENTPTALRGLLNRCLERDPRARLQAIGEARIALAHGVEEPQVTASSTGVAATRHSLRSRVLTVAALVLTAAALGWTIGWFRPNPTPPRYAFSIFEPAGIATGSIAISPDGRGVVFTVQADDGTPELWYRMLDSFEARRLPETYGARYPFWSPDSREVAYFAGDSLKRVALDGTQPRSIAAARSGEGGAWGPDGTILYGTSKGPIHRVAATGGQPAPVTTVEAESGEEHYWPVFLPDGRRFVYLVDGSTIDGHVVKLASLDGGTGIDLASGVRSSLAIDPAGFLIFVRENQLLAYPMDFESGRLDDASRLIAEGVNPVGGSHHAAFSVSATGTIAYQRGSNHSDLVWIDDHGQILESVGENERFSNPRVSPNGRYVAVEVEESSEERLIWVYDGERGVRTLLSSRGILSDSVSWSPDSAYVYFDSEVDGEWSIYRKPTSGAAEHERLDHPGVKDLIVQDVSPDGTTLAFTAPGPSVGGDWDLYLLSPQEPRTPPVPWLVSPNTVESARFSPDSRWLAYVSDESGQNEVYVRPVDVSEESLRWQISSDGGSDPGWSPDGDRMLYRSRSDWLISVPLDWRDGQPRPLAPVPLFEMHVGATSFLRNAYDVGPDGRILTVLATGTSNNMIRVLSDWNRD